MQQPDFSFHFHFHFPHTVKGETACFVSSSVLSFLFLFSFSFSCSSPSSFIYSFSFLLFRIFFSSRKLLCSFVFFVSFFSSRFCAFCALWCVLISILLWACHFTVPFASTFLFSVLLRLLSLPSLFFPLFFLLPFQSCSDYNGCVGSWSRCAASLSRHQLWSSQHARTLHPQACNSIILLLPLPSACLSACDFACLCPLVCICMLAFWLSDVNRFSWRKGERTWNILRHRRAVRQRMKLNAVLDWFGYFPSYLIPSLSYSLKTCFLVHFCRLPETYDERCTTW